MSQISTQSSGAHRAVVIKATGTRGDGESAAITDPWANISDTDARLIPPPFDLLGLSTMWENSTVLRQCIEAMSTNISGHGWMLRTRNDVAAAMRSSNADGEIDPVEQALIDAVADEHEDFDELLTYIDYDGFSTTDLRGRLRFDLEATGNAFIEVVRNRLGAITALRHVPAYTVRIGRQDTVGTKFRQNRPVGRGAERGIKTVVRKRRFRFFAQVVSAKTKKVVYFKQYLDPRRRNRSDGKIFRSENEEEPRQKAKATEMIHLRIPAPRTPYGMPRYVGVLLTIWGSRAGEEINYVTLRNNNVPSLFVLASNGFLTEGSMERLEEFVEGNVAGSDNYSKVVVLEAEPLSSEEGEESGNTRIEVKEVKSAQQGDALFQKYDERNRMKIRESFRLAPVFLGQTDDYTRSTAEVSRRIVDEQVFAPERREEDAFWTGLLVDMGCRYHTFRSHGPNVSDDEHLSRVMAHAERSGAMTPRRAQQLVEDILGRKFTDMPQSIEMDVPFSLQMADAVKNQAMPNEVGQQTTALKTLADACSEAGDHHTAAKLLAAVDSIGVVATGGKDGDELLAEVVKIVKGALV